ncbi:DUF885 domain-containing protein [soil metagenome]
MLPMLCCVLMAPPTVDEASLAKMFQVYLDAEFKHHPAYATAMGNHDYDDKLDDLSLKTRRKDHERNEEYLKDITGLEANGKVKIDLAIWRHALELQLWQTKHDDRFTYDPRVYGEYITDSVYALFTQSTLPRERNVANAASRITYIPKVIAAAKESLKNPPKILTEIAIKRTQAAITFYSKDIYELAGETAATSELKKPCDAAVIALKEYVTWLEKELLPRSTGEWRLGKERFAKKLELELNAGLTAEQVIQEAEAEATRVERELYVIAKQLWFKDHPNAALLPDDAAGRRKVVADVLEKIGEDRSTSESLLADTKKTVEGIRTFIREKKILTLPEPDKCDIIEMPAFKRGYSVAYLENAPPLDSKAKSYYAVSPPLSEWSPEVSTAILKEYNKQMLQILTIHEAYPGHYVQLEYANRNPSLIRKVLSSGVYIEGWAVYTEQMMLDQGYGNGNPALRMQQLKFYLRAVLNAILDHHMHCSNWTDEQAMKLLMDRGFQTEGEALGKVQRAKQQSGQLSTYFVGRTAHYRLRVNVSRAHGDKFDLAKFHEAVLNEGSVPVKYLPELVK